MAVLNKKYGYLFLSEPHCASRSVSKALVTQHDGSVEVGQHDTFRKLQLDGFVKYEPIWRFSIVRHPCDWMVTRYCHMTQWHNYGFTNFVIYHLKYCWQGTIFQHARDVHGIIKLEELGRGLEVILSSIQAPMVYPELIGETVEKAPWQELFTKRLRDKVREYLHRDFTDFDYRV